MFAFTEEITDDIANNFTEKGFLEDLLQLAHGDHVIKVAQILAELAKTGRFDIQSFYSDNLITSNCTNFGHSFAQVS